MLAGHCLDFGDSALPYLPVLRGARPARGRAARDRRRGRAEPPGAGAAAARAAGCWPTDGAPERAGSAASARPRRPLRRRPRAARAGCRARPRCCWSSRTATGPTSRPATCSASCSPGRSRGSGRRSWRPTAPTTCTAGTRCAARSRSGRGCTASSGCSSSRCRRRRPRRWSPACRPTGCPEAELERASSAAPRATRSSSRSWSAPPGRARTAGPPTTWPTCCSSASTGSTRRPAGGPGRQRRRPQGLPRPARGDLRVSDARSLEEAAAQAVEMNVLVAGDGPLLLPARPARARPSTTTCCPASGSGCTRRTPRRSPTAGRREPRPSWRGTPALANDLDTALSASDPGRRRGDGRRRPRGGRPALRAGPRAAGRPGPALHAAQIDVSKLAVARPRR